MNSTLLITILTMVQNILPQIGISSQAIQSVIQTLIGILPIIIQEYKDVLPYVKNIIAILSGSDEVTPEQLAELKALDAQVDAAWDAAVDDYMENHPETDK